jgi:asparagine synthase (glutamine-hydrolysing)
MVFAREPSARAHLTDGREAGAALLAEPFDETLDEVVYTDDPLRNRMLNELRHESVPVILEEDDRDAMAVSVENRSPFLDRALADFLFTVPSEHLSRCGRMKAILRDSVAGLLPDPVRLDARKRGFNASILSLLDPAEPAARDRLLAPGPIFDLVRRERVEGLMRGDLKDAALAKVLFAFTSARLFLDHAA